MNAAARVLGLLLALALAGCADLFPAPERGPDVDSVLAEVVSASRAPQGEQKAALGRAQQAYAASASPLNRLKVGLLLATLSAPLRDDARAAELLEPLADLAAPGPGRVAAWAMTQIAERQRLAREAERTAREADRASKEREKLERERAAADKERDKREEAMRQQLEALRAIERGIMEREERLRRRQR